MHNTLKNYFQKYNLDALLISDLNNVRYLSNFTGTNGMILATPTRGYFFTDFRYTEQAAEQVKWFKVVTSSRDIYPDIKKILEGGKIIPILPWRKIEDPRFRRTGIGIRLGFEAGATNYAQFLRLQKSLDGIKLVPVTDDPALLRVVKNKNEITKIERALKINKLAFEEVRPKIKPGKTEIEIKTMLEIAMLKHGADKIAFDTIVASGWRGALPHGVASHKKIRAGELVTIDFGCVSEGYNSDETVTVLVGEPDLSLPSPLPRRGSRSSSPRQRGGREERYRRQQLEIHQIVFEAQRLAIAAARPGAKCSDLDKAARDYITQKGYGKYFGHALGHGVGLEVHERPVLSPNSTDVLEEGMVFTIEPGIYIPKFGGVRIEDVFVCTKSGVKQLSKINKKLGA